MGAAELATGSRPTRRYRSPRREQQARRTRARIIAAAADRFLARAYAATTMRAVAADAGIGCHRAHGGRCISAGQEAVASGRDDAGSGAAGLLLAAR